MGDPEYLVCRLAEDCGWGLERGEFLVDVVGEFEGGSGYVLFYVCNG